MQFAQSNQQLNFFTNNEDVTISPVVIGSFLNALSKFGLIPTFGQELNALTGGRTQVLIMTNPEQTYKIEFPSHAVIVSGVGMSSSEFNDKTVAVLGVLESLLPNKKSHRLAFISSSIYIGSPEEYQKIYDKLFTYKDISPFEWDNRIAQKIKKDGVDVEINHVSTIRRCYVSSQLINSGRETEVIMFENDTNTAYEEKTMRYDWRSAIDVFSSLSSISSNELKKIGRYTK